MLAALATPWPLIWLTALSASRIFLIQLAVALVLSFVLSWPKLRYALVPRSIKHAQGHEAASREFLRRGLTRTREKTGVLIYLALAEHHAEILADTGIADRVDAGIWAGIVADLTAAIGAGRHHGGADRGDPAHRRDPGGARPAAPRRRGRIAQQGDHPAVTDAARAGGSAQKSGLFAAPRMIPGFAASVLCSSTT